MSTGMLGERYCENMDHFLQITRDTCLSPSYYDPSNAFFQGVTSCSDFEALRPCGVHRNLTLEELVKSNQTVHCSFGSHTISKIWLESLVLSLCRRSLSE